MTTSSCLRSDPSLTVLSFEVQLGIIAASTPAIRPGYKWLTRKVLGGTTLLSDKSSNKHLDFENGNSRTKDTFSKKRGDWTEIEGEDTVLPAALLIVHQLFKK